MKTNDGFAELLQYSEFDMQLGGLVGLLVGDAVGVGFEFKSPNQLPPHDQIDMQTPVDFRRSHPGVLPGTFSDDGSQALCLLASLLEQGRFSLTDFASKLVRWFDEGYMAVDGRVFDCGIQTASAIDNLRAGVAPDRSGGRGEYDSGNGSLMRVLPLALWHTGTDEELVRDAHLQSLTSHAHPRPMVACALYVLAARGFLQQLTDTWTWADGQLQGIYQAWPNLRERETFLAELDVLQNFPKTNQLQGSGYVLDSFWSAREALREASFEEVIRAAVSFGNDTDTTAAVAGGLAGIRDGLSSIPRCWLDQLRGFELVAPLIPDFLAKMGSDRTTTAPRPSIRSS